MDTFDPDSYCGLCCGACEILNAYRDSLSGGRPAAWDDLPTPLRDNIAPADIVCRGCRTETVFAGCRGCRIRECARERKLEACVVCPDHPCEKVAALLDLTARVKAQLPHTATIFRDADIVRERGYRAWAEAQRARWACPSCGAPFTWYQERCGGCGRTLDAVRGY